LLLASVASRDDSARLCQKKPGEWGLSSFTLRAYDQKMTAMTLDQFGYLSQGNPLMRHFVVLVARYFVLLTLFSVVASGQEWTRFRGPNGTGLSQARSLPAVWTQADYDWRVKLPGEGHSSPVLWGDKIFLMSADPQNATRYLLCYSATDGVLLWQRVYPSSPHHLHQRNTFASGTAAVDAERVYVAWSTPESVAFLALDHEGREVWSLDLGTWTSQHGFGLSPMLFEDLVILSNNQQAQELDPGQKPGDSYMLAVDARTGAERWRTPRTSTRVCYSTPCIYQPAGQPPQLICTSTAEGVFSLDPRTGKENWRVPDCFRMRVVSSPLVTERLIFGSNGSGGGGNYLVAVRPGADPAKAYEIRNNAPYVPCALAKDGLLFLFNDRGMVSCADVETGEIHWRERLSDGFSGSPVYGDGKVFCIADDGTVFVIAADREFKLLGSNPLGEPTRSTPAIASDRLFFRTLSHLTSVGGS
jgi:outer membrane protein assembly factor BamB